MMMPAQHPLRQPDPGPKVLLATTSRGKVREWRELLAGLPVELLLPADLGIVLEVEETGTTFRANADLKARAYHAALGEQAGIWTLAEDSGLEVAALGGEPGVWSARWGGTSNYGVKMRLLLERLRDVPERERGCRYVCAVTLIAPEGTVHRCRGEVRGRIALEPRGSGGFGYDPLFFVPSKGRTMAELSPAEKHAISHRARAARCVRAILAAAPPCQA